MPTSLQVNSPGWRVRGRQRGAGVTDSTLEGLPAEFLTRESRVAEEVELEPAPTRGDQAGGGTLDLNCAVEPGQVAVLVIRHPSGALTIHPPVVQIGRGARGPSQARFVVPIRQAPASRGIVAKAVKAIVVKAAEFVGDKLVSLVLPKLVTMFETNVWKKRDLTEGWLKVTKDSLAARKLVAGTPVSPERSLLFIHGTFSNAAAGYHALADSTFFERVKDVYGDRIFAFDHFSLSRTPEENARMLLKGLPSHTTTFDVITHSRGGLVLRNLVERAGQLGPDAERFKLGRAVLVASPNEGTPLATPDRWERTVGLVANILEMFPDNPFTTGAAFVANALVWLANHASGDIPGLHAMDTNGDLIAQLQEPPGPPADAYSALVANYTPTANQLKRLLDAGLDQFFGTPNDLVVPTQGGWQIDRGSNLFIPGTRIGCFGRGGNLPLDSVTHVSFFPHAETVDFLVNGLTGQQQRLNSIDPRRRLPDRGATLGDAVRPEPVAAAAQSVASARGRRSRAALPAPAAAASFEVSVVNDDLTFETAPLLLGHYSSEKLTGTEGVMDRLVGRAMSRALQAGIYPHAPGSHQIFLNRHEDADRGTLIPRPKAVIVAGLGDEGKLEPVELIKTVRLAVLAWARHLAEYDEVPRALPPFELASTLISSGGTGVTAEQAADLIIRGVQEANEILQGSTWPVCGHLRFVELYLDRATEAWTAIRTRQEAEPGCLKLKGVVKVGSGSMTRPAHWGYRGADYDFITVQTRYARGGERTLEYTMDTRRARSEVRGQRAQSKLLDELVATSSSADNRDPRISRTLFNLVIPVELEAHLTGGGKVQMSLDETTAAIPWELLDSNREENSRDEPWSIRVKLLRKLRLEQFRPPDKVKDATADDSVLVIGEPQCPKEYPPLPGAREEALAVHECLTGPGGLPAEQVRLLAGTDPSIPGPDAGEVLNTLFERRWRIVHIAGHGALGQENSPSGVVLSNDTFLSAPEIESMRVVPELVFVNCCHLAQLRGQPFQPYNRARFASSVAGALIKIGVRCVVAAGWAVDDAAAKTFAEEFYTAVLQRRPFIDAIAQARSAAFKVGRGTNTWAAYQCYGDPDWVFRPTGGDANQAWSDPRERDVFATALGLRLELERIKVQTKSDVDGDPIAVVNRLIELEKLADTNWSKDGALAEAFGAAYFEAGAVERAVQWYTRAVESSDGRASLKAAEQLSNARGRLAWEKVDTAARHRIRMEEAQADLKPKTSTAKARADAGRAARAALKAERDAIEAAGPLIADAFKLLNEIIPIKSTMERENLVASAYKRRALVHIVAGRQEKAERDLRDMKKAYERALEAGRAEGSDRLYYPAANCLVADLVLTGGKKTTLDREMKNIVKSYLANKKGPEADFWSVAAEAELEVYEALARRALLANQRKLERGFARLHERARPRRMWASVYDNACLVLGTYGDVYKRASTRTGGRAQKNRTTAEQDAARDLLNVLKGFAHPG